MTGIEKAIKAAGGMAALAHMLGLKPNQIWMWANGRARVPGHHCPAISRATGVPPGELRPDIYPPDICTLAEAEERAQGKQR